MYFNESSKLINNNLTDKDLIRSIDRELAHTFLPGGTGYIELALLVYRTNSNFFDVERILSLYESAGVVSSFNKAICPCGNEYRPDDGQCMDCHLDVSGASEGERAYSILRQPLVPVFDPSTASDAPQVFISYRRADSAKLAADIYYSLRAEGYEVFLDEGEIPVGANPEKQFLTAASNAASFIALVSQNYFDSGFCKKEIAHAARCRRRLIRVNVPPVPSAPNDMPWIDDPNWVKQQGDSSGLSRELEQALLTAVRTPASPSTIADNRYGACQFLLEQMTFLELDQLWNRLEWMRKIRPEKTIPEMIRQILQNTSDLGLLCKALAP
jgi:hypothetical protein